MSTYLAKNNNTESMEKVSDEVKRKECEFYNILCLYMELEDKFLKWSFMGRQNSTPIFVREVKFEKWNLFLQWAIWIHRSWQRAHKAESNKLLHHVRSSADSQVNLTRQIFHIILYL